MTDDAARAPRGLPLPGLTACRLCAGETLGAADTREGGQLARLREVEGCGIARLTLADCLDECERGDVVVVRPGRRRATRSARPVWFERLAGDELTGALTRWLADGGPGVRDLPAALREREIRRTRRGVG